MTEQEQARLRFVRMRIARIKRLQRKLDAALVALDVEQQRLAVAQWEHDHSYKLRCKASQFTEDDAAQMLRLLSAIRM